MNGGVIVSNDNYRDLIHESIDMRQAIQERFMFVGNMLMLPSHTAQWSQIHNKVNFKNIGRKWENYSFLNLGAEQGLNRAWTELEQGLNRA